MRNTIARISTTSTANLKWEHQIAKGYAELAARIEEREECKIDKELAKKAQNSQRIKWDYQTVIQHQAMIDKVASEDPEWGQEIWQTYALERQKVACNEGRLPQDIQITVKPSNLLENQEVNTLYIPMHIQTKLGTHVLPALIDTGATQNFLSHDAAEKLGLTWKENDMPKPVTNADGSKCGTGRITLYCDIPMKLDNLWKEEWFYKAETGTDQVVLGIPWLANFKPMINWTNGTITEVLEVPLHRPTQKVKKKTSWNNEPSKPASCSIQEEELNSWIKRDWEKEDAPWSGEHCPNQGIRPGGDQLKQPTNALRDKDTLVNLAMLQTTLEAKKAQCNNPMEQDLIQDYLEDLVCLTNRQLPPETTQEIEPEHTQSKTRYVDKQILQTQIEELCAINNKLCEAQGIEEIPWWQSKAKPVPLPLEVSETYKEAARMLGLFKSTVANMAEPKEWHKKGIKAPIKGTKNALAMPECQPKLLPGLEYLEDLEDEDPTEEPGHMIVENHDLKQGQKAQNNTLRLTQRGVKHNLSDPHTWENKHLDQEEVQGLEHMVMADHRPKKGMAPQLKPQFNPLFFPFATCLPNFSIPQDYDPKEGHNVTLEAHSIESSTVDTSKLTSLWPDQWQLKGLDNDMTDPKDPWPDEEGTNR